MSKFSNKLSQLQIKEQRLLSKKRDLISKWKKRIGDIAEKAGLLTVPDAVMAGLFVEAQLAFTENLDQLKDWEEKGKVFLKSKQHKKSTFENSENADTPSKAFQANIEG